MILEEHFQPVLELMQQAIQLDPQAEYYVLKGEVQARNPEWQAGAVASYRDALRCRPDDADLRLKFGKALEKMGDKTQAGIQYRAALELRPNDVEAQSHLESFEESTEPEERGLMTSLKTLFQRGDRDRALDSARAESPGRSPLNRGRKVRTPTGSMLANGEARRRDGKCSRE